MRRKEYTGQVMDEVTFWANTRLVDWRAKCRGPKGQIDLIKTIFFLLLPHVNDLKAYRARHKIVRQNLGKAINSWESSYRTEFPCSDDSFDDLINHIIGLGEEEYNLNIQNPKLAFDRAEKYDYVESFAYCIPYENDYQANGKVNYHPRRNKW